MKRKINLQLIIIALLAIFLTAIGTTVAYYELFRRQIAADLKVSANLLKDTHYFTNKQADIGKQGNADKRGNTNQQGNIDQQVNLEQIDLSSNNKNLRITWIAKDGTVLYDNDAKNLPNHMNRPEIEAALQKGSGEAIRQSDTMNESTYYYALRLENGTVLRLSTNASSLIAVFQQIAPVIALILLFIVQVCIALSRILTKQLIKPIELLSRNLENPHNTSPYNELLPFINMIKKQHADILQAAKARQDFTANVSHELKTPLTAISGYAELLANDMVEKEKKQHFYKEIKRNAERLLTLIEDIIKLAELDQAENASNFTTKNASNFTDVDLHTIVNECLETLQVNAKQRNISLSFTGEHCLVHGNYNLLRELCENLIQNAIRYNKEGGYVKVTVQGQKAPALTVEDNGIGIPAAEQTRIFERFYRVDKSRSKATGGTGLGLAIVKHIVEIHAAKLELTSENGKGTTIKVLF